MAYQLIGKALGLRREEATSAALLFAYSFLAMTAYNIVKPITKSKFIAGFGADNLPWVLLAASILIGILMQGYSWTAARMPRKSVVPASLAGMIGLLGLFWLLFTRGVVWAPVAFYLFGLILGILLISQFWTVANDVYDSRQARRLFGFIGGGASLGGALGNGITWWVSDHVGTTALLLVSAAVLAVCLVIVVALGKHRSHVSADAEHDETGVGGGEAIRLLRKSRHLQIISLVIACAAVGASIADQQLSLAAEAAKTTEADLAGFFGQIGFYLSLFAFFVQVGLTSHIHRSLGLTFALLVLPVSLSGAALVILASGSLWAPSLAKALDSSLRYSLDKTTREVLYLPLPADLKHRAKPFVDVTMDRLAKALGALLCLMLIKPWGLSLNWQQLSWATIVLMGLWAALALVARREYLQSFRRSLDTRGMEPEDVRVSVADGATIEALVEELSHPDETAVLYAIDMLETLDKRHLITPLLLHHDSPKVRARALAALAAAGGRHAHAWIPAVRRLLRDDDADVRATALQALASLSREEASALTRRFLQDADPRAVVTAAAALADTGSEDDARLADEALMRLIADTRAVSAPARREAAAALARIRNPAFHILLVPLIHDPDIAVARAAIASARTMGDSRAMLVPALVSLLGHRALKREARETLAGYGPEAVDLLAHVLNDPDEYIWSRRHVPATLAQIPTQRSMDTLVAALDHRDGFLRYKIVQAIETLRRGHPHLTFSSAAIDALIVRETSRYFTYLTLRANLMGPKAGAEDSLIARVLDDKLGRTLDRIFRELALIYPWQDIAAARRAIASPDSRKRARALEYLDNLLPGPMRKRILPIVDEVPIAEKVRAANSFLKSRPRDLEDTLAQLVHDDDPVVAAAAIDLAEARQLDGLKSDLAFVISAGKADRVVLDAAQWALSPAASRGDGPWPVVRVADRLRSLPLFRVVSIDELFRVAATARQVRLERGALLADDTSPTDEVFFLLEGSVRVTGRGGPPVELQAPQVLGFEDMLEGRPCQQSMTALEPITCLTLRSADFLTMLSDNIAMAQGVFRLLLQGLETGRSDRAVAAGAPGALSRPPATAVEKALLLRQSPLLARATVEQLLDLAVVTREVALTAGGVLIGERDEPAVIWVLEGEVRLIRPGDEAEGDAIGAGSRFGLVETLTGQPLPYRVGVTRDGVALRIDHDDLFAVLGDHMDLLQGVFGGVLAITRGAPTAMSS
jgi:ATP/ADP translocase/CRP-like cAMP-binding protein